MECRCTASISFSVGTQRGIAAFAAADTRHDGHPCTHEDCHRSTAATATANALRSGGSHRSIECSKGVTLAVSVLGRSRSDNHAAPWPHARSGLRMRSRTSVALSTEPMAGWAQAMSILRLHGKVARRQHLDGQSN